MKKEVQLTSMAIDKKVHKRAKMWCVKNDTDITKLVNKLMADFLKGKRVR